MKIEDSRSPVTPSTAPVATESARPTANRPGAAGSDVVRLSTDLQVVDIAVRAAAMAGDVRPEAVASARALLERGELGQDLQRLADRIIDSLSEGRDDDRT
jgi:hypothetical protein